VLQRKQALAPQVRPWIARHGKGVDIARLGASHRQTRSDRFLRESRVVLDTPESFFLDGGDELAVAKNRCSHIAVIRIDAENEH
jgi:hypothetical protein